MLGKNPVLEGEATSVHHFILPFSLPNGADLADRI